TLPFSGEEHRSLPLIRGSQRGFLSLAWLVFFLYLLINILLSNNPLLGLYGLIKILELFFLGYYVAKNIKTKKELAAIAIITSITVIGESLLTIVQYMHQSSINGFLYFLGERKFTSITPGIANASINGELILRPYGTFPHPNVLAGYLLCALIFIFAWFDDEKDMKKKIFKTISLLLGSLALFLTLSRIAILLWFFIAIIIVFRHFFPPRPHPVIARRATIVGDEAIPYSTRLLRRSFFAYLNDKIRIKIYPQFLIIVIIFFIGLLIFTPVLPRLEGTNFTEEAISQRADLLKSTLVMINERPLFGVGLFNFLPGISHIQKPLSSTLYLQPVHNIFLLVTAEIGIIGAAFFLWFLFKTYNRLLFYLSLRGRTELMRRSPLASSAERDKGVQLKQAKQSPAILLILLSVILILGLFDHYWLTLQQGQLLFAIILGLCWAL
ncbi:O-antigen ligase family protein, partial [Patescibacteria group bacterium]|nr:O-antigen ligase family protein [Patescibacteria group bacterium]